MSLQEQAPKSDTRSNMSFRNRPNGLDIYGGVTIPATND